MRVEVAVEASSAPTRMQKAPTGTDEGRKHWLLPQRRRRTFIGGNFRFGCEQRQRVPIRHPNVGSLSGVALGDKPGHTWPLWRQRRLMRSRSGSGEPIVSVQRAGAENAATGHLAWGVLARQKLVFAQLPQDWAGTGEPSLRVLGGSFGVDGSRPWKWIRATEVEFLGLASDPLGAVAVIRLSHPSAQVPLYPRLDTEGFRNQLLGSPDVWAALESVGAVPNLPTSLPSQNVVGPPEGGVPTRTIVRQRLAHDPGDVGNWWCAWLGGCLPGGTTSWPRP